jgi:hypothetical protein
MPPLEEKPRAEGIARLLLALLLVLGPAVYVAKFALSEPVTRPAQERPLWAQVLLITVGHWPTPARLPTGPASTAFVGNAIELSGIYAADDDAGPSAVSLLTGRFALNHGVFDSELALPPGAWTLASAAQASGAKTAAFIEADWVTRHAIGGFDTLVEAPEGDPQVLIQRAAQWLEQSGGERRLLWLHLESLGAEGENLESALAQLDQALTVRREQFQALTVFTALRGPAREEPDLAQRVPLRLRLPNSLYARRRAEVQLSHADLAGGLRELLRLPGPSRAAGQADLQSRWRSLHVALQGGDVNEPVWLDGAYGSLARLGDLRVLATPGTPGAAPNLRFARLPRPTAGPNEGLPLPSGEAKAAEDAFWRLRSQLLRNATTAVVRGL